MTLKLQISGFNEAAKLLSKLQVELPKAIVGKALKAAAKPVVAMAKATAPRSSVTGTGKKQSKAQQAKNPIPLASTITSRVVQYDNGVSVAVVGPSYPAGAHGHLVEFGHKGIFWPRKQADRILFTPRKQKHQKDMAFVKKNVWASTARVEGKEFLAPAADSTRVAQESAMVKTLADGIKAAGG